MRVRVRMHRWVMWWFYVGVVCGVVALINILGRSDLTRTQERIILLIGVVHWVLGGLVCYAFDAVRIVEEGTAERLKREEPTRPRDAPEWHPASDFILPGTRKRVLPPGL
ncbi:MAG: hypothetical protein ABSH56_34280 [Bryobacteraceae bacterium]